jgi:hypothetical protein
MRLSAARACIADSFERFDAVIERYNAENLDGGIDGHYDVWVVHGIFFVTLSRMYRTRTKTDQTDRLSDLVAENGLGDLQLFQN